MKKKYILLLSIVLNTQISEEKKEDLVICDSEICVVVEGKKESQENFSQDESDCFKESTKEIVIKDYIEKKLKEEKNMLDKDYAELQEDFEKCFSEISLREILDEEMLAFQDIFSEGIKEVLGECVDNECQRRDICGPLVKDAALRLLRYKEKLAAQVSQALFALEEGIRQKKLELLEELK